MQWKNKFPFQSRQQCDFCASRVFTKVVAYDDLTVVRCSCGYVFMNPFLTESGSQKIFAEDLGVNFPWLKNYDLPIRPYEKPPRIFDLYKRALVKLECECRQQGRLLDIGCGRGDFLDIARKKGWAVDGVDFDLENIRKAKEIFKIPIRARRLEEISGDNARYNVITMWDYFEHVENPLATLRLAQDLLVPGGVLLIACPNYSGLIFKLANLLYWVSGGRWSGFLNPLYPPTHLSYFSPDFLAKVAEREGMRTLEIDYDETDLNRVEVNPILRLAAKLFFGIATLCRASNRFMIYLKK